MKKKQFKKVYIEITNICNLSCDFCFPDYREKEMMTKEQFKYIIEQIREYTDYIYLHVKGEPLLHPDINELIEIACNSGLKINVTTNGTHIEKLNNKKIRQINYSMQSIEDVEEMQSTIKKMRKFIFNTDVYLSLRLWSNKSKENLNIIEMLKKEFGIIENICNKAILDKNVYLSIEDEFVWPSLENTNEESDGYCHGLKDQIAILVDGTVIPCCLDHRGIMKLGNIFEQDICCILNTEKAKNIVDGFKNRKAVEELCQRCGFKNKF